jgi:small GTP-binding protein
MKNLILSYFDNVQGPVVFLRQPEYLKIEDFATIPLLMNLYREGFFMHEYGGYKSANLIFEIPSKYARGGDEILMISLLDEADINPELARGSLIRFVDALRKIRDAYKGFYVNSAKFTANPAKFGEIQDLFASFASSIPAEMHVQPRQSKLFLFGLTKVGKTSIVQALKNQMLKDNPPTISMDISKIFINNTINFMVYDAPGQEKFRALWQPHIDNQDGLVFVVDVTAPEKFPEARDVLHDVAGRDETQNLPLLVLLNKVDLKKPRVKDVLSALDIAALRNPCKEFLTSAVTRENIPEAFTWLANQLASRLTGEL